MDSGLVCPEAARESKQDRNDQREERGEQAGSGRLGREPLPGQRKPCLPRATMGKPDGSALDQTGGRRPAKPAGAVGRCGVSPLEGGVEETSRLRPGGRRFPQRINRI